MYPHERSLVETHKDDPFAIIGVNSDPELEELQDVLIQENITWRSFWNGPEGTGGPISRQWNVRGWPTLFLIDAKGVIRNRWLGSPSNEELDGEIAKLLAEAKAP